MGKYYKGCENKRIAEVNTKCPIVIFVIDLNNDSDVVDEIRLDYADPYDRKRLGRLTFWAVSNNHSIETMALADAEAETLENN